MVLLRPALSRITYKTCFMIFQLKKLTIIYGRSQAKIDAFVYKGNNGK